MCSTTIGCAPLPSASSKDIETKRLPTDWAWTRTATTAEPLGATTYLYTYSQNDGNRWYLEDEARLSTSTYAQTIEGTQGGWNPQQLPAGGYPPVVLTDYTQNDGFSYTPAPTNGPYTTSVAATTF